jgi:hypothetical protein
MSTTGNSSAGRMDLGPTPMRIRHGSAGAMARTARTASGLDPVTTTIQGWCYTTWCSALLCWGLWSADDGHRKSRHEKKPTCPDRESRLLAFVHDVDGVAERLVRRAEYGESGGGRKREIRRVVKELEVVYKGGAAGSRHGR